MEFGRAIFSTGESPKVPPSIVSNIGVETDDGSLSFTWTDPNDIPVEGVVVNQWKGTVIVLNENHAPTNQNDGTIIYTSTQKNKHRTEPYVKTGLQNEKTYYYGIFPYSVDNVYNYSASQTGSIEVGLPPLKPLAEYTWAEIEKIANKGQISADGNHWQIKSRTYFTIGDKTAPVDFGTDGMVTFVIEDFLHDDLADGSGKASISFLSKDCLNNKRKVNDIDTNSGGMPATQLHSQLQNEIFNEIVDGPKPYIKEIKKKCSAGNGSYTIISYNAKLWIPTEEEMFGRTYYSWSGQGSHYTRYTSDNSRIKKVNGSATNYWVSSPVDKSSVSFCAVYSEGVATTVRSSKLNGIAIGFCVGNGGVA